MPTPEPAEPGTAIYQPRQPRESPLFKVLSDHYPTFIEEYAERYQKTWGRLRLVVDRTVSAFLRCGLPEHGFARVRCPECRAEYLLPFSCKTRNLCPSCAAKRTTAWARWLVEELVLPVPHRHVVLTLPKIIRPYFKFDRSLLTDLGRWVNEALCEIMAPLADEPVRPGCVAVLQLAGNLANLQPHVHCIVTSGAFDFGGTRFHVLPGRFHRVLEAAIRTKVLQSLRRKGLLSAERHRLLLSWRHSGFSVFVGRSVAAQDQAGLERLARYARRPHLADSKIIYAESTDRVIYCSGKDPDPGFKANYRILDAVDFVASICGFIPNAFQHETVMYGEYSNAVRGRRKRESPAGVVLVTPNAKRVRKSWRHLIKHVYEVDPLLCRCGAEMRIVSIIERRDVIERILTHLGMWPPPQRPPKSRRPRAGPAAHPPPSRSAPRPHPSGDDHEPSQALPWNEEDLSQAPPGWLED